MTATAFWAGRSVLVTGATGMIGSWLCRDLVERGARVVAFVADADPQSELIRSGDIDSVAVMNGIVEDFRAVERAINLHEVQVVFHLAAQTIVGVAHRSPLPTLETNIRGTYNVLEACRVHADLVSGVLIASSDKAYGHHDTLPYTEDMRLRGAHPYEVSKTCADLLAQAYHTTYGVPVAIARCGNVYGGGDLNWSRIVPATIRSFLEGSRPQIRSDGTYVRDYVYVRDVVDAYVRLAESIDRRSVAGEAFNFGNERPMTVIELVGVIQRLMDRGHISPEVLGIAEGEIHSQHLSAAKARELLGWEPRYGIERGLEETIEWYRDFLR